ncbi:hypothetical protein NVS55_30700 [Myxococcus stipitatus]
MVQPGQPGGDDGRPRGGAEVLSARADAGPAGHPGPPQLRGGAAQPAAAAAQLGGWRLGWGRGLGHGRWTSRWR